MIRKDGSATNTLRDGAILDGLFPSAIWRAFPEVSDPRGSPDKSHTSPTAADEGGAYVGCLDLARRSCLPILQAVENRFKSTQDCGGSDEIGCGDH